MTKYIGILVSRRVCHHDMAWKIYPCDQYSTDQDGALHVFQGRDGQAARKTLALGRGAWDAICPGDTIEDVTDAIGFLTSDSESPDNEWIAGESGDVPPDPGFEYRFMFPGKPSAWYTLQDGDTFPATTSRTEFRRKPFDPLKWPCEYRTVLKDGTVDAWLPVLDKMSVHHLDNVAWIDYRTT